MLFDLENCVSILIFTQLIWENVHYVPNKNLISEGTPIKAFYLPRKTNLKNLRGSFVDRRQLRTAMPK